MTYKTLDDVMKKHRKTQQYKKEYKKIELEMEILKTIIKLRKDMGLTQAEFAKKIGKTQPSLARIESGNYVPTLNTLYKIADATGKKLTLSFR